MSELSHATLLIHTGATLYMAGVIWFVQLIHYPLFAKVGENFADYSKAHVDRTGIVVAPAMLLEGSAFVTLLMLIPEMFSMWLWMAGGVGLLVVWVSTFAIQVPCHQKLLKGFDDKVYRRLVHTNWIRTVAWSARGGVALWMQAIA